MLQSMGLPRVRHNLMTEQQQQISYDKYTTVMEGVKNWGN